MSYRVTSPYIELNAVDVTAKTNLTIYANTLDICDLSRFKDDNNINDTYMTFEQNYSILDGTMEEMPDNNSESKLVYYSDIVSNEDCTFTTNPTLTFICENVVTSAGITLKFGGKYLPKLINVAYYNENNTMLFKDDYSPDEFEFYCPIGKNTVLSYKKVVIEFISTSMPNNFIKVNDIAFGVKYKWDEYDITKANIFEETDILSNQLSSDTLSFSIYSEDDDFNILKQTGIYYSLQKNQEVDVYENIYIYEDYETENPIETKTIYMGKYYSNTWESQSKNEITFKCIDMIGKLKDVKIDDTKSFYYIENEVDVGTVIDYIMDKANVSNYTVTEEVRNKPVYGYILPQDCRQALLQVLFSIGAVATCSRSKNIDIYIPDSDVTKTISDTLHIDDDMIRLDQYVNNVYLSSFDLYSPREEYTTVFKGYLDIGTHKIKTKQLLSPNIDIDDTPETGVIKGTGTIVIGENTLGLDFFTIEVTQSGEFKVICRCYEFEETKIRYENNYQSNIRGKNIAVDKNYFLCNIPNIGINYLDETALRMINYYNKRNSCECTIVLDEERTGDWVYITNQYGNLSMANILNMDIDLSGGFIAKCKMVCYQDLTQHTYDIYASNINGLEIYAGETIGIL